MYAFAASLIAGLALMFLGIYDGQVVRICRSHGFLHASTTFTASGWRCTWYRAGSMRADLTERFTSPDWIVYFPNSKCIEFS
ncbi:hypothetical protein OIU78_017289 [Salix suchowensis]|nr:hypothetical protein IMY05_012G0013100 [Salix suchowensis]KAJ6387539.1 hypothetical protein OIU78_017289 [Salix suchowensis]